MKAINSKTVQKTVAVTPTSDDGYPSKHHFKHLLGANTMSNTSKTEANEAAPDHFSLHAKANSPIAAMKGHEKCSFVLTPTRLKRLRDLNPEMYQWITDCEKEYASVAEGCAGLRTLFDPEAVPVPISPLVFELHAADGMTILISSKEGRKNSLKFVLKFLNQLHKDRALLARLFGSAYIQQSLRLTTHLDDTPIYFSLRPSNENAKIITVDAALIPSISFPHVDRWRECGLGWLLGEYFCCNYMPKNSKPWKEHVCR
jgi:hypothetical protein